MRLAKSSRIVTQLALSAALATCAVAQEHPNVSPNAVRNQLNQPADASQSPQQSEQGPSQAEIKLPKKKATPPVKATVATDAKAQAKAPASGSPIAPVNASQSAAGNPPSKAPAGTPTKSPASPATQTTGSAAPKATPPKASATPANAAVKAPASAATQAGANTQARPAEKAPAKSPSKAAEKPAAAAKGSEKAVAVKPAKAPVEKAAVEKPVVRRDPFDTLLTKAKTTNAPPENLPPGKAGLIVATLRIDGIVRAPNGAIAIVSNSQGRVYFLRDGDKLYDGSVDRVSLEAVSFHEVGKDAFGHPLERTVTKRLYPSPGEQQ